MFSCSHETSFSLTSSNQEVERLKIEIKRLNELVVLSEKVISKYKKELSNSKNYLISINKAINNKHNSFFESEIFNNYLTIKNTLKTLNNTINLFNHIFTGIKQGKDNLFLISKLKESLKFYASLKEIENLNILFESLEKLIHNFINFIQK